MILHYTPKSHFARKVRILLAALEIEVKLVDAGNVADNDMNIFASNPLMKVPTLIDGNNVIFDSDHIAQYIVINHDPQDRYKVLTDDHQQLNLRAVMNGVMTAEVEVIMAERTGIDTKNYTRFDKLKDTVDHGMYWLEQHSNLFSSELDYALIHLVCLWDHLALYQMFKLDYPKLRACINNISMLKFISLSSP